MGFGLLIQGAVATHELSDGKLVSQRQVSEAAQPESDQEQQLRKQDLDAMFVGIVLTFSELTRWR